MVLTFWNNHKSNEWVSFLKTVFMCSLGAYGGPEAHYAVFIDQLSNHKQYVTEEEILELMALTTILPGPSSTQTLIAIGYKVGGPVLALLTFLVWAMPVIILMSGLSFLFQFFEMMQVSSDKLRFIGPMAVGFIVVGAYRVTKKVVYNGLTLFLYSITVIISIVFRTPFIYPLLFILGGFLSVLYSHEQSLWRFPTVKPKWHYFILFVFFAIGSIALSLILPDSIFNIFENFYRYGYLVIGGGQVVVPFMHQELVETYHYMTNQEFLTGFGLVQGLPGPMFSFSAYAGGLAMRTSGPFMQFFSGILSGIAIFLPGILLIYFVYPIWNELKQVKGIKVALIGIVSIAAGLLTASGLILFTKNVIGMEQLIVFLLTIALLIAKKCQPYVIVLMMICLSLMIG